MKQWIRSLPAKIICFILCVVCLALTVASVLGGGAFASAGFYNHTEAYMVEDRIYSMFCSNACDIIVMESENKNFDVARTEFSADNTNLRFQLLNADGVVIAQNTTGAVTEDGWTYYRYFEVTPAKDGFSVNHYGMEYMPETEGVYTVRAYLEEGLPKSDNYALAVTVADVSYKLLYAIYPIGIVSLLMAVICFILLMCTAGRKPNSEELHPGLLNRVPFDLLIACIGLCYVAIFALIYETSFYMGNVVQIVAILLLGLFTVGVLLGLCMSVAARMKQKTLFKNTVIWMFCKLLWNILRWCGRTLKKFVKGIPLVWKTVLIVVGISIVEFIVINGVWYTSDIIGYWFIEKLILVPVILYIALSLRKLQQGGAALAKGDLHYKVDTRGLVWEFRQHGENLNSLASGMTVAVEERLQSERMKTELITNVSHDIKTPLTSIINYANLIGEEECESEHHKEYAEVLVRKSEHLKRLLDDLVEISKAASGNLEIALSSCDAGVLLTQVAGEFEQRCQEANLELVTNQPETAIQIMADSRRIWRVFENLMSNACKYSLPGSRVYLSLEKVNQEAIFTFRNTSRTALNISPEELMERFVRGDASRSTEGNGLGLSIASSLTELQNGKMDITIDGDLFKVTVRFPTV